MPQSPKELERIGEEAAEKDDERFELEDTAIELDHIQSSQMALRSALNMPASDFSPITTIASLSRNHTFEAPPYPPPQKPLPPTPPEIWKGGKTLAARRRKNRSSSPLLNLTRPLAGMGDSLNWKVSVLHRFNAIQYTT